MKFKHYILALLVLGLTLNSCKKDDGSLVQIELRDRGEQYLLDIAAIEEFLSTHFYNYEEFQADPNTTDFDIIFDTIAGANSDKIPLMSQVGEMQVTDREDVQYTLYFLKVREGLGDQPTFADSTFVTYKGTLIDHSSFDGTPNPVWFDLPGVVQGFREAITQFKGSTSFTENPDGTFSYNDYGIGAMFIPSGLGYFSEARLGIPSYSPLIFEINLFEANEADHDRDHVPSYLEDIGNDRDLRTEEDNTDGDFFLNYLDIDDDGDGTLTKNEDLEPDPDPLVDSNGDGIPDNDIGDGDPTNDDTDGDGIPNYLDTDNSESRIVEDNN